jgi:uncharacterized protein YjbI with pentapeptide repeats
MFRLTSIQAFMDHVADFQTLSYTIVEDLVIPLAPLPDMAEGTFLRCDFSGATMPDNFENGFFVDCRMVNLRFNRANFFNAHFVRCDFSQSQFLDCDLSAAQFEECRLSTTVFCGCDLDTAEIIGDNDNTETITNSRSIAVRPGNPKGDL